jgi:PAS domain S-box-containing protein
MMIDLMTQPCMASKLTNFVEIITQISAAQCAVLLLDQSPDWVVAAHAAESIKTYTVFPQMRWYDLDYLSRECLQTMRQGQPTGQTQLLGSGLICSYFPLVLETHLYGVLCIVHSPGLAARMHDLVQLQCRQMAMILQQSSQYHQLLDQQLQSKQAGDSPYPIDRAVNHLTAWQNRYEAAGWASGQILYEWNFLHNSPTWGANTEQILGYCADAMPGNFDQWTQLVHPDDRDSFRDSVQTCINQRQPLRIEYRILHADGEYRWVEDRNHVFVDSTSYSLCVVGFIIDIHPRKLDDERLKATHQNLLVAHGKLEQATRLKDEFLACMSHELRTPLNSILGIAEMLSDAVSGPLNPRQTNYLHKVTGCAEHLLTLINDILDVAKIEAGTLELKPQPVRLQPLCESSLDYVSHWAAKKSIQLQFSFPEPIAPIMLDERRMRQVLINLLSNAIKFTDDHGAVDLSVTLDPVTQSVTIAVRDSGIGIRAEDMDQLFQPFIQIDSRLARDHEGTGLGLVLSQRIVTLHGGRIEVESQYGQGSCFRVMLPDVLRRSTTVMAPDPVAAAPDQPPVAHSQPVILLAEDNALNAEIFCDYLSTHGYKIVVASDGEMALSLAQQHQPDLLLIDIQLPKRNGLEVIQSIRQHPSLADRPIMALTALAMASDQQRCLEAGADAYLAKPVKLKDLAAQIQVLLSRD